MAAIWFTPCQNWNNSDSSTLSPRSSPCWIKWGDEDIAAWPLFSRSATGLGTGPGWGALNCWSLHSISNIAAWPLFSWSATGLGTGPGWGALNCWSLHSISNIKMLRKADGLLLKANGPDPLKDSEVRLHLIWSVAMGAHRWNCVSSMASQLPGQMTESDGCSGPLV